MEDDVQKWGVNQNNNNDKGIRKTKELNVGDDLLEFSCVVVNMNGPLIIHCISVMLAGVKHQEFLIAHLS